MIHYTNITLDLTNAGSCYPFSLTDAVFRAFHEVATIEVSGRMSLYGCRPSIYKLLNVKLSSRLAHNIKMTENSLTWADAKIEKNGAAYKVEILNPEIIEEPCPHGRFLHTSAHDGAIYDIINVIYTRLRKWLTN